LTQLKAKSIGFYWQFKGEFDGWQPVSEVIATGVTAALPVMVQPALHKAHFHSFRNRPRSDRPYSALCKAGSVESATGIPEIALVSAIRQSSIRQPPLAGLRLKTITSEVRLSTTIVEFS
jgi:hypothetical protein